MRIEFDEDKHEYSVNGVKVPSVSEILAPLSADRYGQVNPWVLQAAAERGRAVHEATQLMDYGFDPDEDFSVNGYLIAYQDFLSSTNVEWIYAEKIVCAYRFQSPGSNAEDNVTYAGTLDRYGKINGQDAIVDIKTYASLTTDALLQASCQTALYRAALLDNISDRILPHIKRYVLHLKKDGSWRLVDLEQFDRDHGFSGTSLAFDLVNIWWTLYNAKQAKKRGKKGDT